MSRHRHTLVAVLCMQRLLQCDGHTLCHDIKCVFQVAPSGNERAPHDVQAVPHDHKTTKRERDPRTRATALLEKAYCQTDPAVRFLEIFCSIIRLLSEKAVLY
jgi:hypothetical protein